MDFYSSSRTLSGSSDETTVEAIAPIDAIDTTGNHNYQIALDYDGSTLVLNGFGQLSASGLSAGGVVANPPLEATAGVGMVTLDLNSGTTLQVFGGNLEVNTPNIVDGTTIVSSGNEAEVNTTNIVDGTTLTVTGNQAQVDTSAIVDGTTIQVTGNQAHVDAGTLIDGITLTESFNIISGNYETTDPHLSITLNQISTVDVASAASLATAEGDISTLNGNVASLDASVAAIDATLYTPITGLVTVVPAIGLEASAALAAAAAANSNANGRQPADPQLDNLSDNPGYFDTTSRGGHFNIINNATTTSNTLVNMAQSTLATGNTVNAVVGTLNSTNNSLELDFNNIGGTDSALNTAGIGLVGGPKLTIDGNGNFLVPGILRNTLIQTLADTTSQSPIQSYVPSLAIGNLARILIGTTSSTNDSAEVRFNNTAGSMSVLNTAQFGLAGSPKLSINGNGEFLVPGNLINLLIQSLTGTGNISPIQSYVPSLSTGNMVRFLIGEASSTNNSADVRFNKTGGTGSALNTVAIGLAGSANMVTVDGSGNTTVPGSLTVTTGPAIWSTAPTADPHLTNKLYVDNAISTAGGAFQPLDANLTSLSGGSPSISTLDITTGPITWATAPTADAHLTNKLYVDNAISTAGGAFQPLNSNLTSLSGTAPTVTASTTDPVRALITGTTGGNGIELLQASLATADSLALAVGTAATANDAAVLTFTNNGGTGSSTNQVSVKLANATQGLKVDGVGSATGLAAIAVGDDTTTKPAVVDITGGSLFNGTLGQPPVSFQYFAGGYRHFIKTRHVGATGSIFNAVDFYINDSTTSGGSTSPGVGNVRCCSMNAAGMVLPLNLTTNGSTSLVGPLTYQGSSPSIIRNLVTIQHASTTTADFGNESYTTLGTGKIHIMLTCNGEGNAKNTTTMTLTANSNSTGTGTTYGSETVPINMNSGQRRSNFLQLVLPAGTFTAAQTFFAIGTCADLSKFAANITSGSSVSIGVNSSNVLTIDGAGNYELPATLTSILLQSLAGTASTSPIQSYVPALATGNLTRALIGTTSSTNDSTEVRFNNTGGSMSALNTAEFGLAGSAKLSINGNGEFLVPGNLTNILIQSLTGTGSQSPIQSYVPSLATSNFVRMLVGEASSTNNSADIRFTKTGGTGSALNTIDLGLAGATAKLTVNGSGKATAPELHVYNSAAASITIESASASADVVLKLARPGPGSTTDSYVYQTANGDMHLDTELGQVIIADKRIQGPAPSVGDDLTNKTYVDSRTGSGVRATTLQTANSTTATDYAPYGGTTPGAIATFTTVGTGRVLITCTLRSFGLASASSTAVVSVYQTGGSLVYTGSTYGVNYNLLINRLDTFVEFIPASTLAAGTNYSVFITAAGANTNAGGNADTQTCLIQEYWT